MVSIGLEVTVAWRARSWRPPGQDNADIVQSYPRLTHK